MKSAALNLYTIISIASAIGVRATNQSFTIYTFLHCDKDCPQNVVFTQIQEKKFYETTAHDYPMDPANEDMSTRQIAEVLYNVPNLEKDDRKVWIQHADSKLYAECTITVPNDPQQGIASWVLELDDIKKQDYAALEYTESTGGKPTVDIKCVQGSPPPSPPNDAE